MNIRSVGTGFSINLREAAPKPGQQSRKFYFEPSVISDLTKGNKFNQGSIEIHPEYGVSIYLGHRSDKKPAKPEENKHEP